MSKTSVLTEIKNVIIAGFNPSTYIYPTEFASIPINVEPIVIVQEARAVDNKSSYIASKCLGHSWQAEILVIIGRGEVQYPSAQSAAYDVLANDLEIPLVSLLAEATFSDSISNSEVISNIGWYQWEKAQKKHEPIYVIKVLLPISEIIEF